MMTATDRQAALFNKLDWVTSHKWNRLHYVRGIGDRWGDWWEPDADPGYLNPEVVALCGSKFAVELPGFISRMTMPRCAHCCDRLNIPRGQGAAFNDDNLDDLRTILDALSRARQALQEAQEGR